ncbi:hypothetical protein Lal_00012378 [Lupinus albus]|nr:hypothetical protein Lal_00012378 [Lupinus albus]
MSKFWQMVTSLNPLQYQNFGKLPFQTMLNLKNVSVITLRSGKQTDLLTHTPYSDFKNIDGTGRNIQANCTKPYTCHAYTDSEIELFNTEGADPNFIEFVNSILEDEEDLELLNFSESD